jgi:hypothetical protein
MFTNIEVLDKAKHADLRFSRVADYNFAKDLTVVPLGAREMIQASKYYSIVFSGEGHLPHAILSLKKGNNGFYIDADGQWKVLYIPAHIRRYPFILAKGKDEKAFAVCIDKDAPHFQNAEGKGAPLFDENGNPADILTRAMTFLKGFQADLSSTELLLKPLFDENLIVPKQLNLEKNGEKSVIAGFSAVDLEKLNGLDDGILGKWVKSGLMNLVYAHLNSLGNVRQVAALSTGK